MIENPVLHQALPGAADLNVTYGWASGAAFVAATDICLPIVQILNIGVFLVSKIDTARCVIPGCVIADPLITAIPWLGADMAFSRQTPTKNLGYTADERNSVLLLDRFYSE
jgi:hypothetical protein